KPKQQINNNAPMHPAPHNLAEHKQPLPYHSQHGHHPTHHLVKPFRQMPKSIDSLPEKKEKKQRIPLKDIE
ncbi:MAG: hypothetical protein WC254_03725, partial [Candidatus Woesearchaeota archaeon]